jgi:methylmalonyl-CoA/ethylmalonyl-CoA epimerase
MRVTARLTVYARLVVPSSSPREMPMKAREIDHICFAVHNLDDARTVYEQVLGMEPACEYESAEESIRVVRYYVGSVAIEIMEPTDSSCEVARFLAHRGEGFFLISYRVDDVEEALHDLKSAGHATIDEKPRTLMGNRYAFIMPPKALHGVLTEVLDGTFQPVHTNSP